MLSEKIIQIFWHHRRRNCARRIADELNDQDGVTGLGTGLGTEPFPWGWATGLG